MRRRSEAGPERAKSRSRKTVTQKRRGLRNSSAADHKTQSDVAQLTRERDEALEREKATAEVLQVISSSSGALEPVFQAMLANATRICAASYGIMFLCEGNAFRTAAVHGALPVAYTEQWRSGTLLYPDPRITCFPCGENSAASPGCRYARVVRLSRRRPIGRFCC